MMIPELMSYFRESEEPVEAQVEAHWEETRRPDKLSFCGATYDFCPRNGLIAAQKTTVTQDSLFQLGVILHPNTTVCDSAIRSFCEVSNTTTIINSRIGHGCLIGSNVVIDGCKVLNHTQVTEGEVFVANSHEAAGRDYRQLAYEGARW